MTAVRPSNRCRLLREQHRAIIGYCTSARNNGSELVSYCGLDGLFADRSLQ